MQWNSKMADLNTAILVITLNVNQKTETVRLDSLVGDIYWHIDFFLFSSLIYSTDIIFLSSFEVFNKLDLLTVLLLHNSCI